MFWLHWISRLCSILIFDHCWRLLISENLFGKNYFWFAGISFETGWAGRREEKGLYIRFSKFLFMAQPEICLESLLIYRLDRIHNKVSEIFAVLILIMIILVIILIISCFDYLNWCFLILSHVGYNFNFPIHAPWRMGSPSRRSNDPGLAQFFPNSTIRT